MNLVARATGMLVSPRREWETVDTETTSIAELYTGYIMPLAGIAAIVRFLSMTFIGTTVLGVSTRWTLTHGLMLTVIGYITVLIMVYILALVVDAAAPTFGAEKNQIQAFKVVAYSFTAAWIGGMLSVIPWFGWLGLVGGLYSLYILYLGLPVVMKCPRDKAAGYTVVIVLAAILVGLVIGIGMRMVAPGAMGM
ncbi:MAG TPA: Yip1 family protein [Gemmatimonadales bacterium]|jgi:hypothetical protein